MTQETLDRYKEQLTKLDKMGTWANTIARLDTDSRTEIAELRRIITAENKG